MDDGVSVWIVFLQPLPAICQLSDEAGGIAIWLRQVTKGEIATVATALNLISIESSRRRYLEVIDAPSVWIGQPNPFQRLVSQCV
jgi:hypothetical protein